MTTRSSVAGAERRRAGFTLLEVLAAVLILGVWFTVLGGAAIQGLHAEGEAAHRLRAEMIADARMSDLEGAAQVGALPAIGDDQAQEDEFEIHTRVAALDLPTVTEAALAGGVAPAGAGGGTASPGNAPGATGSSGSSGAASSSGAAGSGAQALASRLAAQRAAQGGSFPGLAGRSRTGGMAGASSGTSAGTPSGATGAAAGTTPAAPLPANASFFAPTPGGDAPPLRQLQVEVVWGDPGNQRSVVRTSYALDSQAAAPLLQALDQAAQAAEAAAPTESPSSPDGTSQPSTPGEEPEAGQ